jgi:valyl-tRNA synthetase
MLLALSVLTRLFAPFLPFVADETWSWWHPASVHTESWPTEAEIADAIGGTDAEAAALYRLASDVLGEIRKQKTLQQLSPGAAVPHVTIFSGDDVAGPLQGAFEDLRAAVRAQGLSFAPGEAGIRVEIAAAQGREP